MTLTIKEPWETWYRETQSREVYRRLLSLGSLPRCLAPHDDSLNPKGDHSLYAVFTGCMPVTSDPQGIRESCKISRTKIERAGLCLTIFYAYQAHFLPPVTCICCTIYMYAGFCLGIILAGCFPTMVWLPLNRCGLPHFQLEHINFNLFYVTQIVFHNFLTIVRVVLHMM